MDAPKKTHTDAQRSPTFLIVLLVIMILAIVSFLVLHPRGSGASNHSNPSAPASSH